MRYYRSVLRDLLAHAFSQFRALSVINALAILGVAIGAANIIALISVTDTARYQSFSLMRDVGASALFVMPFVGGEQNAIFQRSNVSAFLPMTYADALRSIPELDRVAALVMFPGHIQPVRLPGESAAESPADQCRPRLSQLQLPEPDERPAADAPRRSTKLLTLVEGANPDYPDARGHASRAAVSSPGPTSRLRRESVSWAARFRQAVRRCRTAGSRELS